LFDGLFVIAIILFEKYYIPASAAAVSNKIYRNGLVKIPTQGKKFSKSFRVAIGWLHPKK